MPQSREERKRKRRLAEKNRRERIKNTDKHEEVKAKARERYHKRKAEGKILKISQMNSQQKKKAREKARLASKIYRQRQKARNLNALDEDLVICNSPTPIQRDPLCLDSSVVTAPVPSSSRTPASKSLVSRPHTRTPASTSRVLRTRTRISHRRHILPGNEASYSSDESLPITSTPTTRGSIRVALLNNVDPVSPECSQVNPQSDKGDNIEPISSNSSTISSRVSSPINVQRTKSRQGDLLIRKLRYKTAIDIQLLHKRVQELKTLNNKYRKQLSRFKNAYLSDSSSRNESDDSSQSEENEKITLTKDSDGQLRKDVRDFYLHDENSRMCAGKKEFVKVDKNKVQKRYLNDTLHNLHVKFLNTYPHHKIHYSYFCKLKPLEVKQPNLKNRDTCLCKVHTNMQFMIKSLRSNNLISENSITDVLKSICCDSENIDCLSRQCVTCKHKKLQYKEFQNDKNIYYWTWKQTKVEYTKDNKDKTSIQSEQVKMSGTPKEVIAEFEKQLQPFLEHCSKIISQSNHVKALKQNLSHDEAIIHVDFSENYATKYANEIQAFHFGNSRTQITLHTVMLYYICQGKIEKKAFCTLSKSLRHDAAAIWEHLTPILSYIEMNIPSVTQLHFISDSPSSQYRNRKMFYVISKLYWDLSNLTFVTWNYSESGHGKGAPDGIGGSIKRVADDIVCRGNDISNLTTMMNSLEKRIKNIILEEVIEDNILQRDMLIPTDLPKFQGTMKVHQVVWERNKPSSLAMRKLSCFLQDCAKSATFCEHGQHIGFYDLNEVCNKDVTKKLPNKKTTNKSLVKKSGSGIKILAQKVIKLPSNQNKSDHEATVIDYQIPSTSENILPPDDSFWTPVSGIDSICDNTSVKNLLISEFQKDNKSVDSNDSDSDDFVIFDCQKKNRKVKKEFEY